MNRLSSQPTLPLTAFILAGGRSRRMGTDKALQAYLNSPLIQYAIRVGQSISADVRIIGEPGRYASLGLPVIPDIGESLGPLSGIYTALQHSPTLFSAVMACDMPLMSPSFFQLMIGRLPGPDAVAMRFSDGAVEPLCSIYSSTCLAFASQNLANRKLKIADLLSQVAVEYISEDELHRHGLTREIFTNVNTPEDLSLLASYITEA